MAQKTIVTLVDDLTGEEAENINTVEFVLDGVTYELDLTDENSTKLRDALSQYAKAGRKIGGRRRSGLRPGRATKSTGRTGDYNRETLKSMREWAKKTATTSAPAADCPPRSCRPDRLLRQQCPGHRPTACRQGRRWFSKVPEWPASPTWFMERQARSAVGLSYCGVEELLAEATHAKVRNCRDCDPADHRHRPGGR